MRVRFAPSPTGVLHIGSARTALYNWLLARGSGGDFVLRIEDTDRERSTPENIEEIYSALRWLGLDWDEGPIFQTSCAERHAQVLSELLESGHAYYSTATSQQVQDWKQQHGGRAYRGEAEASGAVRLRIPDSGSTTVVDQIRGAVTFEHEHIDDLVIARSDGSVLYNFAVAVDDCDAGITHVVRGEDHLSNTPKQVLVFEAMGKTPPHYAHLPLLHGTDGKKLSKRHGAASVEELRAAGYLPAAVRNYISLLGWGWDDKTTFFTTEELIERFSLERVSSSPAVFDEQKLRWMNGHYVRDLALSELTTTLEDFCGRTGLREVVAITREKFQTLGEFWPLAGFCFDGPIDDPKAWRKVMEQEQTPALLTAARTELAAAEAFDVSHVEEALRKIVEEYGVKPKQVFQPVRVALAGTTVSPGIFETVVVLGQAETLKRIDSALQKL